jgi:hypothetical protein
MPPMPNVLSTINGTLCSCATCVLPQPCTGKDVYNPHTLAISLIGLTLNFGFPMLSTNMAFVFSSIAAANAEGASEVTNLTDMPNFFKYTT